MPNTGWMKYDWRGILSMTFLITALLLFVAFNILPSIHDSKGGWRIWPELCEEMWDHSQFLFREPKICIELASFLCISLLIVVCPFFKNVWSKSRMTWRMAVIFSGLTAAVFWGLFCIHGFNPSPRLGLWCLLFAPVLNFIGLLLARPQWLKKSGPSWPPESESAV